MSIKFYSGTDPQTGCFSNFSPHSVHVYGQTWKTSEHPFQAMKYWPHRPDLVKRVWEAPSPSIAARLGRHRGFPLREDWDSSPDEEMLKKVPKMALEIDDQVSRPGVTAEPLFARVKDVVMYEVCLAKFSGNAEIRKTLVDTFPEALIEDAQYDPYWGWGCSHVGENKLGRILMLVRLQLLKGGG